MPLNKRDSRVAWWKLEEAVRFIKEIDPLFRGTGWALALYGSVLHHGEGRDLDLLAVPMIVGYMRRDPEHLVTEIVERYKGRTGEAYSGLMETKAWAIVLPDRHVVDLCFRVQKDSFEVPGRRHTSYCEMEPGHSGFCSMQRIEGPNWGS